MLQDTASNSHTISVDALMELMLNGSFSWDMQDFRCFLAIIQVCVRRRQNHKIECILEHAGKGEGEIDIKKKKKEERKSDVS